MNPSKLKIDSMAYLSDADLLFLASWSESRRAKFPSFAPWLEATVENEQLRRADPLAEAGLIEPPSFDCELLADALPGCYILARLALTDSLARFADELERHVMASASAMLAELASNGVHTI